VILYVNSFGKHLIKGSKIVKSDDFVQLHTTRSKILN